MEPGTVALIVVQQSDRFGFRAQQFASLMALFLLLVVVQNAVAADKPNIVYILVDNWGWGDISAQGGTLQTPNIDDLAGQGLRLTNFNVQNQCTPTRSALHTGRLPIRSGTQKVPAPGEPDGLALWEYTIAELLSDSLTSTHRGESIRSLKTSPGQVFMPIPRWKWITTLARFWPRSIRRASRKTPLLS